MWSRVCTTTSAQSLRRPQQNTEQSQNLLAFRRASSQEDIIPGSPSWGEKAAQHIGDLMGAAAFFFDRILWYPFLSQSAQPFAPF